jgi:hypothetical protein
MSESAERVCSTTRRPAHNRTHLHGDKPSHCIDHYYHHRRGDLNDFAINLSRPAQQDISGYKPRSWTRRAVSGGLVLLGPGPYREASNRQPSGGGIGAILGACIEGNRRAWGGLMDRVDDGFE